MHIGPTLNKTTLSLGMLYSNSSNTQQVQYVAMLLLKLYRVRTCHSWNTELTRPIKSFDFGESKILTLFSLARFVRDVCIIFLKIGRQISYLCIFNNGVLMLQGSELIFCCCILFCVGTTLGSLYGLYTRPTRIGKRAPNNGGEVAWHAPHVGRTPFWKRK